MSERTFHPGDALIVVDVQNDFCPGGSLPVPHGDEVVAVINRYLAAAREAHVTVVASRDWHPKDHISFAQRGGPWPEHCVQDSPGAAFHPDLALPDDVIKVSKGVRLDKDQYSAFDDTGLGSYLRARNVQRVWVAGLALEVCVRATVISAREEGFDVCLIEAGTRALDDAGGREALQEMRQAGARMAGAPA
jgi:nicotinamidase/pyrazinamidase